MNMSVADRDPSQPDRWSGPRERITVQIIHWAVVLLVVIATTILAMRNDLDKASVTALFGTVLGHAGTAASQKLSSRG
jgi:hypothetical protein